MDFIIRHALCFASHLSLLWLWHRAKSKLAEFKQAFLAPFYRIADFYLAMVSLFRLVLLVCGIWGIWLLFHNKTSFDSN